MKSRWVAGAALALLGVVAPVAAQAPDRLAGAWNVEYADGALRTVRGRALVARDGRTAEVEFDDPAGGKRTLRSTSIERSADGATIRFEGAGVAAGRAAFEPSGKPVAIPNDARTVPLRLGNGRSDVGMRAPQAADSQRVTVHLRFTSDRSLVGHWQARVEATTGRSAGGGGRVGTEFAYDASGGGAIARGGESWARPRARIVYAIPIFDQLDAHSGDPLYPEPYESGGRRTHPAHRDLLVVGRDLPRSWREFPRITAEDTAEGVDYAVQSLPEDRAGSAQVRSMFELALARLRSGLRPAEYERLVRESDLLIVRASIRLGARPGPKAFRLDGALAGWRLQYGDYTGTMSFVRQMSVDRHDPTDFAFVPESVAVEIRADRELPYDEIPLVIGIDGRPAEGASREIVARRVAGSPRVYRTPLLSAGPAYGTALNERSLPLKPGGSAFVQLAEPAQLAVTGGQARLVALASPLDVHGWMVRKPREVGLDWRGAVSLAASCAGQPDVDEDRVTQAEADRFLGIGLVTMTVYRTPVAVGEHAAMLLLRASLIDMLQRARDAVALPLDATGYDAYWTSLKPALRSPRRPAITRVEVSAPDGGRIDVADAASDAWMRERHRLEGDALVAWRRQAMAEARSAMAKRMDDAIERASAAGDCDVDALLALTGNGFEPVLRHARMSAMRLSDSRYVPHRRAGAWLDRVPILAERVRGERNVQATELAIVQIAAFVAFLPAMASELPAVLAAGLVIDSTDFAYSAWQEVTTQIAESRELAFALGASAVLGERRYEEAVAADTSWIAGAITTGFAALGLPGTGAQVWYVARARSSATRRAELVALARDLDPAGFGKLDAERRNELFALMSTARRIADKAGTASLTPTEAAFYRLADRLAPRIDPMGRPDWARDIDPAAWRRVAHMGGRSDVGRLFAQDAANMQRYVLDDDGLEALHAPQKSISEFEAAVSARKRRVGPLEPAFYAQMHPRTGVKPAGNLVVDDDYLLDYEPARASVRVLSGEAGSKIEYANASRLLEKGSPGDPSKRTIVMLYVSINREHGAPDWVGGFPKPLVAGRGVPLAMYVNLRALQGLGVAYGDPRIGALKLSGIFNVRTSVQLRWLQLAHPGKSVDELVRYTDSFRYAQSALEQAGLRATVSRVVDYTPDSRLGTQFDDSFFDPGITRAANETDEAFRGRAIAARRAFAAAHDSDEDTEIALGFDIVLQVEPLRRAR